MQDNEKKSVQQNMLFNTIGSLIYYVCQWFMSVVVVRISGYEDAGILSLAMTVTASPAIVALFNIRSYQVSDIREEYSDATYVRSRALTSLLSYVICIGMVLLGGYSLEKSAVILIFMLFKVVEAFADVYYGIEQRWERMDYAGISMTVRGIGTISSFIIVLYLTDDLLLAILVVALFSFIFIGVYDRRIVRRMQSNHNESNLNAIKSLLITCLPLAIVSFLNNLSINLPRIYLEQYFGSEVMGYYNSVASPTVVIQLAATTLFAPLVPILTEQYNRGKRKEFLMTLKKFGMLVLVLSVLCLIGAKLLGYWGLVLFFGESIAEYVPLFIPVVIMSICIAINASMFSVCTLLREIRSQYMIGIVGVIASFILSLTVVKALSMIGVVYAIFGTLFVQIVIQVAIIFKSLRRITSES